MCSTAGRYDQRRERVEAATPSVLPASGRSLPRNRFRAGTLAVHGRYPRTALVAGEPDVAGKFSAAGIVRRRTISAAMAIRHRTAIAGLAGDRFTESGWDLSALYRQLLTSATYRQQALVDAGQKLAADR